MFTMRWRNAEYASQSRVRRGKRLHRLSNACMRSANDGIRSTAALHGVPTAASTVWSTSLYSLYSDSHSCSSRRVLTTSGYCVGRKPNSSSPARYDSTLRSTDSSSPANRASRSVASAGSMSDTHGPDSSNAARNDATSRIKSRTSLVRRRLKMPWISLNVSDTSSASWDSSVHCCRMDDRKSISFWSM